MVPQKSYTLYIVECMKVHCNGHESSGGVLSSGRSKYEFYLALPFLSYVANSKISHLSAQLPDLENDNISSLTNCKTETRVLNIRHIVQVKC